LLRNKGKFIMNCLVTGGTGFIGINLVMKLLEQGNKVLVIDNLISSNTNTIEKLFPNKNLKFVKKDITSNISRLFKDIDVVYHMAALSGVRESVQYPDLWFKTNVVGTFNILEECRKQKITKIIMASSGSVIGEATPPLNENMPMKPISPYGASKACMEVYTTAYGSSYDMDVIALRFSNVYGPYSTLKISLVAKFIKHILNNEDILIYGDGTQTRDFIFVDDLISAIISCSRDDIKTNIFQVCSGVETSVNNVTTMILEIMREHGYVHKQIINIEPQVGDVKTNYADNSKIRSIVGWSPNTSLLDGLNKTISWFLKNI